MTDKRLKEIESRAQRVSDNVNGWIRSDALELCNDDIPDLIKEVKRLRLIIKQRDEADKTAFQRNITMQGAPSAESLRIEAMRVTEPAFMIAHMRCTVDYNMPPGMILVRECTVDPSAKFRIGDFWVTE